VKETSRTKETLVGPYGRGTRVYKTRRVEENTCEERHWGALPRETDCDWQGWRPVLPFSSLLTTCDKGGKKCAWTSAGHTRRYHQRAEDVELLEC